MGMTYLYNQPIYDVIHQTPLLFFYIFLSILFHIDRRLSHARRTAVVKAVACRYGNSSERHIGGSAGYGLVRHRYGMVPCASHAAFFPRNSQGK